MLVLLILILALVQPILHLKAETISFFQDWIKMEILYGSNRLEGLPEITVEASIRILMDKYI